MLYEMLVSLKAQQQDTGDNAAAAAHLPHAGRITEEKSADGQTSASSGEADKAPNGAERADQAAELNGAIYRLRPTTGGAAGPQLV